MKKIDLHIHTSPASYEEEFQFSLDVLKEYISLNKLDIIAITNHNHFSRKNFEQINKSVTCVVYPGVEVDLEGGHLLVISPIEYLDEFESSCELLSHCIKNENDYIDFNKFKELFGDYNRYILIPHFDKRPKLNLTTINKFNGVIKIGEAQSAKKFEKMLKEGQYVPVLFSDLRMMEGVAFSTRQTYVDIDDTQFSVLKLALTDNTKVYLNNEKKNNEFVFLPDGSIASTKLNVIVGKRSSGKTTMLNKIYSNRDYLSDNIKYIKQFSLTGDSEETKFSDLMNKFMENKVEEYLEPYKCYVKKIIDIDDDYLNIIDTYLVSLKDFASKQSLQDGYSKTKIFNESSFDYVDNISTKNVIISIDKILDYKMHEDIVNKYINKANLVKLLQELIVIRKKEYLEYLLKKEADDIITFLKKGLSRKSSLQSPKPCNLSECFISDYKINQFNKITNELKVSKEFYSEDVYGFKIIVSKKLFENVKDLKSRAKISSSLNYEFKTYYKDNPFKWIKTLSSYNVNINSICSSLIDFDVKVENSSGCALSGGERAEFNLLKELKDAEDYDILLLDEPEASFDNPFIKEHIIDVIKDISNKTTVFLTTHNNTLGMLMKPNKIIYAYHEESKYDTYVGDFGSQTLANASGDSINTYSYLIDVMEAGEKAYIERRKIYETLKD